SILTGRISLASSPMRSLIPFSGETSQRHQGPNEARRRDAQCCDDLRQINELCHGSAQIWPP
ncbi:MAG: hypothetical protein ACN6PW_25400, partial [Pseudomonas kermanshahensis]|uniref:hypothetical protein n=1 Tax=Pseudomonas kermanshahensis TaxID=2745482 RepID=UPI003D0BC79C